MDDQNEPELTADVAPSGHDRALLPMPGEVEIRAPRGTLPASRAGVKHGWHSQDAVQIPTSLTCNLCPLYHVKRKDRRHPLACPQGRINAICPVLTALQQRWAFGLIGEVTDVTGAPPTPSDNARIEQIVRHRSRIFQIENYLKVAGLIDLKKGEIRAVADRLTTTENALSRTLAELRQAMAERRSVRQAPGPRLEEYLLEIETSAASPDPATETSRTEESDAP
jgi:hypothetical protein